jgi:hypothetical protein
VVVPLEGNPHPGSTSLQASLVDDAVADNTVAPSTTHEQFRSVHSTA